jgi:signal peptidase I
MNEIDSEKKELSETNKSSDKPKPKKFDLLNLLLYLLGCYLIALLLTTYVFTIVTVDGASMYPTLNKYESKKCSDTSYCQTYDMALTDLLTFKFLGLKRFDIVIIDGDAYGENENIVKRIIGLPNEKIRYQNGTLYVNDEVVEEDFIDEDARFSTGYISEFVLGTDEYFVMGDNRGNSKDSRMIGPIHKSFIKGRGLLKYLSVVKDHRYIKDKNVEYKFYFPFVVK